MIALVAVAATLVPAAAASAQVRAGAAALDA